MLIDEILKTVVNNPGSGLLFTPPYYKDGVSYFFSNPVEIIKAVNQKGLFSLLDRVDEISSQGKFVFGFFTYEAGYAFEKKLNKYLTDNENLFSYFCFFNEDNIKKFLPGEIEISSAGYDFNVSSFRLNTSFKEHREAVEKIKYFISEGDTYQVNYTIKGKFNFSGNPGALFKQLIYNQSAQYTAFINTGEKLIISVSPEIFFKVEDRKIIVKPMKGTSSRGYNSDDDEYQRIALMNSEKDKAENLMIVDLLRNDLGRICKFGSVNLSSLFDIEKYETLFQMISVIDGELFDETKFSDIIKNIYPSGSVTGAPKIRTMEIINELEKERREVYTGSIGFINNNEMKFNVAIRTVVLDQKKTTGELGIGSGIVWDSNPQMEYEELLLKSKFLTSPCESFELFETMKVENGCIPLLNEHLDRLKKAADFFLFLYDEKKLKYLIQEKAVKSNSRRRCKLKIYLNKFGKIKIELSDYPLIPEEIRVIISDVKINSHDPFRYFKTTSRKIYDEEHSFYSAQGFFDVLFMNEKDNMTEGAITNVFIRKNGRWYTPPIEAGILNGIFRAHLLLKNKNIAEKDIFADDLIDADEIKLTNALRGEMKVDKIYLNRFKFKEF
jgi:para-aminobenzoate synthetase/4-amino-4-deoxychorismate lyase